MFLWVTSFSRRYISNPLLSISLIQRRFQTSYFKKINSTYIMSPGSLNGILIPLALRLSYPANASAFFGWLPVQSLYFVQIPVSIHCTVFVPLPMLCPHKFLVCTTPLYHSLWISRYDHQFFPVHCKCRLDNILHVLMTHCQCLLPIFLIILLPYILSHNLILRAPLPFQPIIRIIPILCPYLHLWTHLR